MSRQFVNPKRVTPTGPPYWVTGVQDETDEERAARAARFRDPYGRSALHPGRRTQPCPTCKQPNRLTPADVRAHYQCDECADRDEGLLPG